MRGKAVLRRELLDWRRNISKRNRCLWDCSIALGVLRLPQYTAADRVLCYLSSPDEVSTAAIIAHAIGMGKRVGVPRWSGTMMDFRLFTDYNELIPDRNGLMQPQETAEVIYPGENTICIVPALAADRNGYRLGYGGGYYDRFLTDFTGYAVVPIYSESLRADIPREEHDRPADCIVMPEYTIIIAENKEDTL